MKQVFGVVKKRRGFGFGLMAATLSAIAAGALVSVGAQAQSAQQATEIVKALGSGPQLVVTRLSELDSLPADEWRFHDGDLPHGESTSLDDSSWQTVNLHFQTGKDASWFRRWIEVPKDLHGYDLTGTRIWFSFRADADGAMPEIIYFNGRRVALGEDLEPIVLFDNAKPGDKVLVAVKLLNNNDKKTFNGTELKIDFAENRPNPEDIRKEILSAALLVPSVSKNVSADTTTLQKAVSDIDLSALDAKDQAKFDESLKQAQSDLDTLKPEIQSVTAHITGNSHIDAAWLWPWTETVDVVKRTFSTALQLMNEYPDYTYTQSAAAYNSWMADKYPEINDQIKKRIKEGRWEVVGGMWVEPDLNMPDGEAQVRSILVGKRFFQKEYGVDVRIGWNPDSFGYTWQLPQIYKRCGIDYFVTQKMTWSDTNQLPFKLFWWESPDGSKVLTYFPHDYANNNLNPVRLSYDLAQARERAPGTTEMMDLYGIGDHGGGPTRSILDEGVHWSQPNKVAPKYQWGTAQSFFSSVEKQIAPESKTWDYTSIAKGYQFPAAPPAGEISIPTWNSELYLEYHRGVFTTQANHKRNMRNSEEEAINAEKYASLAWLDGNPYPGDRLTDDWKKITFNDFHDLAAGSGIGIIYKEAQEDYDKVRLDTNDISETAIKTLSSDIDTKTTGEPVLVLNPLAWDRSGDVTVDVQMASPATEVSVLDAEGHVLPSQIISKDAKTNSFKLLILAGKVPSLGYKVVHVVPGVKPYASDLKAEGLTLENANLKVVVDKQNGCITSLYDKRTHFESIAAGSCGNQLQTFKDLPKDYDAWNIDPGTLDHYTPIENVDSVELIEKGPLRAVIRVARTWQSSKFVQDITLEAGADEVNVVNDFDWHETHVLLKAAFPLAATSNEATYEIPYGTIKRATTRNNSWEKAQFEVPVLRWADLGDDQHGFSLINNSKYGYDGVGNMLRLSLLRSPTSPDPEADRGHHHFTYALYPHGGDWKQALSVRHGYEYNYVLSAAQVESHSGSLPAEHAYVTVKPEDVVLTALKKAEDANGLIFRVYEWAGKSGDVTIHVPKGATDATATNLMEKPEGQLLNVVDDTVTVPIHPYQILTVRVDYPTQK
ncbi:glycoside hydrolase family 38 C-terminal domain-containing protein [Acidicapsa dinghuensis]|uniref:Glycoside hydrolase family 38 C-terminal domain-containing protein n=1 Tax=Acidicapsa dinghuensis TaxID=2218256 RepID=A0ABW1EEA6_9BACT|nr:glycoside hydrolase family 38 C-terminal domain-containing protein [Acidicapsa dinghuensis]